MFLFKSLFLNIHTAGWINSERMSGLEPTTWGGKEASH